VHFAKAITYVCLESETRYKFDELMHEYGLDKSQTSRLLSCYDRYFEHDEIKATFNSFSKCKLFELLIVPVCVLERDIEGGRISPGDTVKKIRKYARLNKSKKGGDDSTGSQAEAAEIDESAIPAVFDPAKKYDFQYFEKKNKAQLLNIAWAYHQNIHKQKKEKQK